MTIAHCEFALAFFEFCLEERWLTFQEYNALVANVKALRRLLVGCQGKHPFPTRSCAQKAAERQRDFVEAYHCEFCGKYHVGSPSTGRKFRLTVKRRRMAYA